MHVLFLHRLNISLLVGGAELHEFTDTRVFTFGIKNGQM